MGRTSGQLPVAVRLTTADQDEAVGRPLGVAREVAIFDLLAAPALALGDCNNVILPELPLARSRQAAEVPAGLPWIWLARMARIRSRSARVKVTLVSHKLPISCAVAGRQASSTAKGSANFIIGGIVVLPIVTVNPATNNRRRAAPLDSPRPLIAEAH
jgi:hypothetical protein